MRFINALLIALAAASCKGPGPLEVRGEPSRVLEASVGQEIQITLSTIGPGNYVTTPEVTGAAVQFVDAAYVGPFTPGGPNQLFRFTAVARGQAVLRFQHTYNSNTVIDTVVVR